MPIFFFPHSILSQNAGRFWKMTALRLGSTSLNPTQNYLNKPPPIVIGSAGVAAYLPHPNKGEFHLHWSADGQSVAVLKENIPLACILNAERKGFSKNLIAESPWGYAWNQIHYDETFHP